MSQIQATNLLECIGNTPLVRLRNIEKNTGVKIFAKLEFMNPGGSIKDRPAMMMIKDGIESGKLTKDKTIIEATSGNTGVGLAMIAAHLGYKCKIVMSSSVSQERIQILEGFGVEVVLSDAEKGTDGAICKLREIVANEPGKYFYPDQFSNPANPLSHYVGTAPEIYEQLDGKLDYFVAGMGSTGTLMGCGDYFREKNKNIKIIGLEPHLKHNLQGLKNMVESVKPKIYQVHKLDQVRSIFCKESYDMTRRLAAEEGLFVGMSSGANVLGSLQLAKELNEGVIVTVLTDRGDRYLSTDLFRY